MNTIITATAMTTATPVIPAHQEEYISYIMKEIAENNGHRTGIDLQIKKVDGMDVNVYLILGVDTQLTFAHIKILSSTIYEVINDDVENKQLFLRSFNVAEYGTDLKFQIANILLDCKLALGTIKFVKKLGVYCSVKTPHRTSFCEAYEIGEETGVVSVFQDCCVCYDKTITLTPCNHSLCIPCWGKTPESEDDGEENRLCPVCREIIY